MNRASLLILLLFPSSAIPQDLTLEASLGLIDLVSGFEDDPLVIPIAAGGQENAEELGSDCYGLVADRPDVSMTLRWLLTVQAVNGYAMMTITW